MALPLGLGGCAGVLVVGGLAAAGGTGYVAGQERGVNGLTDDITLKGNIQMAFVGADPRIESGVTTTVYGGRALLTGRVATPEMKARAAQIAGSVRGVRSVYDEVVVGPPETAWGDSQDDWITAQLRSKLVMDPGVRSVNYTIDTQAGAVYLLGSARTQGELERVTRIARYVPGVKRVVSYVELRSGSPVAAMPAPGYASPQAPAGAPTTGPAAPDAPIEVQKL